MIRRSFIVALQIGFLLICVAWWYLATSVNSGGQLAESPDGKFMMTVWRDSETNASVPYRITVRDYQSSQTLREFTIKPIDGKPNQILRGGPRVITWDESSQFADLTFDGQPYCRVYVPTSASQSTSDTDAQ